jgi:RHS repeat-associated protein
MQKITSLTYKTIVTAILLLLCFGNIRAQPLILSSPGTTGNYSSNVSVTLAPGFSTTGPFTATIQPVDCLPLTTSPTLTSNYVISNIPLISGFTDESQLAGQGSCQLMQSIQYVDGLGRPIQTIQVMASPFNYDMIQPQAYDQYGREVTKYLPYTPSTGTAGSYRPTAVTAQQTFYNAPPAGVTVNTNANADTKFDNSPLNRPVEQGAPGTDWQLGGHTVKMDYASNNNTTFAADPVNSRQAALYTTTINSSTGAQTLSRTGNTATYAAGELSLTIGKDENWTSGRAGTMEEYKDDDGHVVLKRAYNNVGTTLQQLSTYYVYDDLGHLAFVLPPGANPDATAAISAATLNNYCYQYQYDGLGRLVQKRIPGKGWEYAIYNNMDQVVATQDSLQRPTKQWIYSEYDAQGRVVISGTWTNPGTDTRAGLQSTLTAINSNFYESPAATTTGYTNVAWPTTGTTTPLTINYYDSYSNAPGFPSQFAAPTGADPGTRGQLVATKTAVLNTPANMLWSANYYDYWDRSLTSYAQHYLGGTLNAANYDAVSTTYDFSNSPTTVIRKHWNTASTTVPLLTIINTYLYDHVGRKLKTWEQIQNGASTPTTKTLLSKTDYNEIGQVKAKNLHSTVTDSTTFLQPIAYTYNERGWLQNSSASLFHMQLQYNTGANKQYNGNIAYQLWGIAAAPNDTTFTYTYDKLNRLTSGTSNVNDKETGIAYDVMGNITALSRYQAGTLIDSLAYTYSSTNMLQSLADKSGSNAGLVNLTTTYLYDGNGNLKSNANATNATQNKSYTYNLLNLPLIATFPTGTATYTYDATGRKLRKVSVVSGVATATDYIDGIQYSNNALDFIQTEEGRADVNVTGYDYQYYLGDNLGNTRVTFGTKTGAVVRYQTDDYMPFGMEINRNVLNPKNEYLYNKKELQEELGQYDYGARFYDPLIGRWNAVDPLAEKNAIWSPYNYVINNPISYTDPNGMDYTNGIYENGLYGNTVIYSASGNSGGSSSGNTTTFNGHNYSVDQNTGKKIAGSDSYYSETTDNGDDDGPPKGKNNQDHWYLFFNDHHPGGDFLYHVNNLTPIGALINTIYVYTTGKDSYGVSKSKTDASVNLAMTIPIFRAGEVINILGNTGRFLARNLFEEISMKAILEDPTRGTVVMEGMNDARWLGWTKMQYVCRSNSGTKVTIHYVAEIKNGIIVAVDDFKFVDPKVNP